MENEKRKIQAGLEEQVNESAEIIAMLKEELNKEVQKRAIFKFKIIIEVLKSSNSAQINVFNLCFLGSSGSVEC